MILTFLSVAFLTLLFVFAKRDVTFALEEGTYQRIDGKMKSHIKKALGSSGLKWAYRMFKLYVHVWASLPYQVLFYPKNTWERLRDGFPVSNRIFLAYLEHKSYEIRHAKEDQSNLTNAFVSLSNAVCTTNVQHARKLEKEGLITIEKKERRDGEVVVFFDLTEKGEEYHKAFFQHSE